VGLADDVHVAPGLVADLVDLDLLDLGALLCPASSRARARQRFLILTGDMIEAVKRESIAAICHWWGVGTDTVGRRRGTGVLCSEEGAF
jgi:hypothetical protein